MKRKEDWNEIRRLIEQHSIEWLYHFTDAKNVPSIRRLNGLYSWGYLEARSIAIPRPGGNQLSRDLDCRDGYEDYVRLCFNDNPPMLIAAHRNGSIPNPVIIAVDPEVIYWEETRFADMNATHNDATTGTDIAAFNAIQLQVARANTWDGEEEKKWRQAEVMVKTHIPIQLLRIPD